MPGNIKARVIKEGVEMTVLVIFIWATKSPPSGRIRRQPGGIAPVNINLGAPRKASSEIFSLQTANLSRFS